MQLSNENIMSRLWRWSGIADKTLLELLQITAAILASVAIPVVLAMLSYQQEQINETRRQYEQKIADERRLQEQQIALDDQRHQILSSYLDQMTQLLLKEKLDDDSLNAKAKLVARAKTLNTLPRLDGERKAQLLKFLYEARLIGGQCQIDNKTLQPSNCQGSILNLSDARLDLTKFERPIPLQGIDLTEASLAGAELLEIDLTRAKMQKVNLANADLTKATLTEAQMKGADLARANLMGAILLRVKLTEARLKETDLSGAKLVNAVLAGAEMQGAKLINADLQGADLRNADLTGVSFQGANFKGALYNDKTNFPDGLNPAREGMRQE